MLEVHGNDFCQLAAIRSQTRIVNGSQQPRIWKRRQTMSLSRGRPVKGD